MLAALAALASPAVATAQGSVIFDGSPGEHAPPAQLDGVTMTKFARDHRPLFRKVESVGGPTGRISFSHRLRHFVVNPLAVKGNWLSWSNHYRGDVYYVASSVQITLPANTTAFYFYAEPNDPKTFRVSARAGGASSGPVRVSGKGGAKFFGFVAQNGAQLTSITVRSTDARSKRRRLSGGFGIGEFGIGSTG